MKLFNKKTKNNTQGIDSFYIKILPKYVYLARLYISLCVSVAKGMVWQEQFILRL